MSDNNDFDDFETEDFDTDGFDDGGFEDLNDQKGTLGDLWRNNPIVKIGVIATAVIFLIGGIVLFGGEAEQETPSRVGGPKDLNEAPGTAQVSPAIRRATEEATNRRTEEAMRSAGSAMPTPLDPPKDVIDLQFDEPEEEDPLERWRRMQQERIQQQQVQNPQQANVPAAPEPEPVDTRTPAVNALSAAMAEQMASILGGIGYEGAKVTDVAPADYLKEKAKREREELLARLGNGGDNQYRDGGLAGNQGGGGGNLNIILPAGTIEYAQMVTEANTDAPGPILAQIVSGPLTGGRMIGSFSSTGKYLTLNFNTVVLDGIDYRANGIAIDPDTTLPAVVTDVNNRYFSRVVLPAAAEFVTGLTQAIADSGTTTITINGDNSSTTTTETANTDSDQEIASGLARAGEEIADIADEIADDIEPLLRVRAGTPIGILFVNAVTGNPQVLQDQEDQAFERSRLLQQLQGQIPALGGAAGN